MDDPSLQHTRLQTALQANGLATDGDFEACLNRLLGAGRHKKRGRPPKKDTAEKPAAATSALHTVLKSNIKRAVEHKLKPSTIAALIADLQLTIDASTDVPEDISNALLATPQE